MRKPRGTGHWPTRYGTWGTGAGDRACRRPPPPHCLPTRHRPRVPQAPLHPRPEPAAATRAHQGTRRPGRNGPRAHLNPTPGQQPATQPGAVARRTHPRRRVFRRLHGVLQERPSKGTQRRLPRADTRSHQATMQSLHGGARGNPSQCLSGHTSSEITPPWGRGLETPPPGMTGTRPQAGQQTRPRTNRPGAAPKGAERVWRRAPTPLASLRNSHRAPRPPRSGRIWNTRAHKATPAAPTPTQNRRRPKTWACGSTGSPRGSGSPWESASDGCLLRIHATSRMEPAAWQTSPSAIGQHRMHPPPP